MKRRWLIVYPGTPEERDFVLEKAFYQIGRSPEALLRLTNSRVSALHASILVKTDEVTLIDLDSTNGTRVNGRRIKQIDLKDKDEVHVAEIKMIYREEVLSTESVPDAFATESGLPQPGLLLNPKIRKQLESMRNAPLSSEEISELITEWGRTEKSVEQLDALYKMLSVVLGLTSCDALLEAVLSNIMRILDLEICGLFLKDENTFFILEHGSLKRETRTETISETLLNQVLAGGAPVFLEEIGGDSRVVGFKSLMDLRIQSLLCLPIFNVRKEVVGALYCTSRKSGQMGLLEKDQLFLSAVSSIISMALKNLDTVTRETEFAKGEEKRRQEARFIPLVRKLSQRNESLSLRSSRNPDALVLSSDDPAGRALSDFVNKAARVDLPVLLTGETGVGKSLWAREIHRLGRGELPFVTVDCTTLPEELIESELFGHEKGAFTGAVSRKIGRVSLVKQGTLFVDEIGELPLTVQGKLLRLLQTGEFEAVGGVETLRCQARLIFATNKDLKTEVREKRFREDLYFRLNVLQTTLPPLRERKKLILPLAEHFLDSSENRIFSKGAVEALLAHAWPGNIRELENAVSRALINSDGKVIEAEHLELSAYSTQITGIATGAGSPFADPGEGSFDLKLARERVDRIYISRVLALTGGNVSQAAKKLNISRNSLMELIGKYKL